MKLPAEPEGRLAIVEVAVRYPPYVGGVERTVHELSRRLVERGHRVTVVCAAEPAEPAELAGVRVVRLPYFARVGNSQLSRGIGAAIAAARPQVVHAHLPTAWWPDAAAAAARRLRVPFVLTYDNDIHGTGTMGLLAAAYNRLLLPRLLATASRVVVPKPAEPLPSPWLRAVRDRLTSIPWGVDTAAFAVAAPPPAPPFTVGFLAVLARAHAYKGLSTLLAAVAVLRQRGLPVRLRVGGSGDRQGSYQDEAARLGIAADVEWAGRLPEAAVPAFYAGCHAFALPSVDARQEGFGLVALEALACGRPLVATPVVAVAAEAAAAGAGLVVPPGDPVATADALAALAADADARATMGERARALAVARYDWEPVTDRYEALLAAVAVEPSRRGAAAAGEGPRGRTSSSQ